MQSYFKNKIMQNYAHKKVGVQKKVARFKTQLTVPTSKYTLSSQYFVTNLPIPKLSVLETPKIKYILNCVDSYYIC